MENSAPRRFQKHPTPLSFGNMSMFRNICKDLKPHRLRAHPRTRVRYRPWEYGKADVAVDRLSQGKDARSWYCQSRENMTRPVVKKSITAAFDSWLTMAFTSSSLSSCCELCSWMRWRTNCPPKMNVQLELGTFHRTFEQQSCFESSNSGQSPSQSKKHSKHSKQLTANVRWSEQANTIIII